MLKIEALNEHISYFKVPYKDIFVGIYVLRHPDGAILFDAAGEDADIDNYIVPALEQLGISASELTHIFISHNHRDHAGGLRRAYELFPKAIIVSGSEALKEQYPNVLTPEDGQMLTADLQIITVPGHSPDSAALLDLRTHTLVSGDCLQSYGIYGSGTWYANIGLPDMHYEAIEKLRKVNIETIATAHDYHPCGMFSFGKQAVAERLDSCIEALERVRKLIKANPQLDDEQIARLSNDGTLPKIAARIVTALRNMRK